VEQKRFVLLDRNGKPYESAVKGLLGGYRKDRIYGRLDCPNALRWLKKGHYAKQRVFFADEDTAKAAGYRPCFHCMRREYKLFMAAKRG
jgi:methylphosphotriester-DNA--protein-cysteine methyltransferase